MNRKFSTCMKCYRMCSVQNYKGDTVGYFCSSENDSLPCAFLIHDDGTVSIAGNGSMDDKAVKKRKWGSLEIPNDCTFYAEMFIKECNK